MSDAPKIHECRTSFNSQPQAYSSLPSRSADTLDDSVSPLRVRLRLTVKRDAQLVDRLRDDFVSGHQEAGTRGGER